MNISACGGTLMVAATASRFLIISVTRHLKSAAVLMTLFATPAIADWNAGSWAYQARDYALALSAWHPLAEQGNVEAQYMLGILNYEGKGTSPSYSEALKWFLKAAEQGREYASWWIGEIYRLGLGDVPQDLVKAYMWHSICHRLGAWPSSDKNILAKIAMAMPPAHLQRAQKQASEWLEAFEKWRVR